MHLLRSYSRSSLTRLVLKRGISASSKKSQKRDAYLLGVYTGKDEESRNETVTSVTGTKNFDKINLKTNGRIRELLELSKPIKPGAARVYHGVGDAQSTVAVVSLGKQEETDEEGVDSGKEAVRKAMAAGMRSLADLGVEKVQVDCAGEPVASAEGVFLSSWSYKQSDRDKLPSDVSPIDGNDLPGWEKGKTMAEGQNFARHLMESPSNLMNPTFLAEFAKAKLESCSDRVEVIIRDSKWIKAKNMGAFLSVTQGSAQPPKFLEIHYKGSDSTSNPLVLVGKGVTFDTGGISIKPSKGMDEMRADMGGAATVTSSILTAATLKTDANVIGLIPLCENMPGSRASRPGDVVTAMDGTTIQVDNTDAEGRLILADAFCYSREFQPAAIVDVATLTGAIVVALGAAATGTFTNSDRLWTLLQKAGFLTGDRVWRMPLYQLYTDQVKPSHLADINNVGKADGAGGSCTAAAFLRHFVQRDTPWAHLDIAGVMTNNKNEVPYLNPGMAGRPSRTLTEFIKAFHSKAA